MTNNTMSIFPMTLIRNGGLPLKLWRPLACGVPDWGKLINLEQHSAEQLLRAFDDALIILPDSALRTAVYNARKDFFQRRKMPAADFAAKIQLDIRLTQILDNLGALEDSRQQKHAAETQFEQNLAGNYRNLQAILNAQDDSLRRALLFASHDLLASLPSFAVKPVDQFDKKDRRTAFSLLQYLTRAVFKTSPLGRFTTLQWQAIEGLAPSHRVNVQEPMEDRIGGWQDTKPLVTPNIALLPALYEVLLREPAFFQSLHISLNPCITFPLHPESSWLYFDGEREAFQQIDPDPVADFVVNLLLENHRVMPFQQIIRQLGDEVAASVVQLQNLLFRLIDIGLLEWRLPEQGLAPHWCGALYNYLGYLPSSPVLTEAAYLLQWMRTAARTMPFQSIEAAQQLQRDTVQEAKKFLEKHGTEMPPVPAEQIFFEDVAQDVQMNLPAGVIEKMTGQLAECWQRKEFHTIPLFRARLYEFAQQFLSEETSVDFMEFSQRFLEYNTEFSGTSVGPRPHGKIGALLQIFQENGEYKAVVNAMYPGGGKLFARWLPLFPAEVSEQVKTWYNSGTFQAVPFPWQGWSNANFQPILSGVSLTVPDGRVGHLPGGRTILLGDLIVRKDERGFPQLFERQGNKPVIFTDLGLEAPETRPPVMQILWHLGVPFVSSGSLLQEGSHSERMGAIRHHRRQEYESLVLARAAWELPQNIWEKLFSEGKSQAERIGLGVATLSDFGVPQQFFGQFIGRREKPQFFDMESPISMLLLEKNLRGGSGHLRLTEMLPAPEQWLGERAAEFVVEFQVSSSKFQVASSKFQVSS